MWMAAVGPVGVGEIAILRAQVEAIGSSSLEVGVRVWAENVGTGRRTVTQSSHLVFVSVSEDVKPWPIQARIAPATADEARLFEEAQRRRAERLRRFAQRRTSEAAGPTDGDDDVRWRFEAGRSVLPDDALFGNVMFPGKMVKEIEWAGGC